MWAREITIKEKIVESMDSNRSFCRCPSTHELTVRSDDRPLDIVGNDSWRHHGIPIVLIAEAIQHGAVSSGSSIQWWQQWGAHEMARNIGGVGYPLVLKFSRIVNHWVQLNGLTDITGNKICYITGESRNSKQYYPVAVLSEQKWNRNSQPWTNARPQHRYINNHSNGIHNTSSEVVEWGIDSEMVEESDSVRSKWRIRFDLKQRCNFAGCISMLSSSSALRAPSSDDLQLWTASGSY